jgi:serine/threonine-protein kinase
MATAQFEHPHVASAIDYGTLPEGGAYFVMQLVRGRALGSLIAGDQSLPWRRVCEIGAQVADALSAAKAAGIIHRDLKPDNILIERREDGSDLVKILDFGIAHVAPRSEPAPEGAQAHRALTRVGTVMGTPGYMSPEQSIGDRVDHRTDLYALGVVLWESITGKELWSGPDLTTVVTRQMTEPVPKLRELGLDPALPVELDELIQRLTARSPEGRPEQAAEVRDTLRRLSTAPSYVPVVMVANAVSTLRPRVSQAVARYRAQPRSDQMVQAGIGALVLIALLALAWPSSGPSEAGAAQAPQGATDKGVVAEVAEAAKAVVAKAVPRKGPSVPKLIEADVTKMLEGKTARERRMGADAVLAFRPSEDVHPHLLVIAELEAARGCKARKEAVAKMQASPDRRYLPPLRRLSRSSKSGCGFLSLEDCLSCVRADIDAALDAHEALP